MTWYVIGTKREARGGKTAAEAAEELPGTTVHDFVNADLVLIETDESLEWVKERIGEAYYVEPKTEYKTL